MSKEAMKLALEHAKRDERHLNHAETRYWCRMYRDIAEKAVEALAKPDFWEGYVPEPVKSGEGASATVTITLPAQQEPVAWMSPHGGFLSANYINNFASGLDKEIHNIPLYTSPPAQRTWVHATEWRGLTDAQNTVIWANSQSVDEAIRATEKQLMENNI
jgi:hypothetical protein